MPAVLDPSCRANASLRRVLHTEISTVRGGIARAADESRPLVERLAGVHQARRGLKRVQALIGLMANATIPSTKGALSAIRVAKASLADTRQRDALARLLEELCALKGNPLTSVGASGTACAIGAPMLSTLGDAMLAVEHLAQRVRIPSGSPLDWHDLATALGGSWRRARRAAGSEWLGRSDDRLHDTRKKFQRLGDQLAALQGCAPRTVRKARNRLRQAAVDLGRARDLALLAHATDTSTKEGRALSRRALGLRSEAVRRARENSRRALVDSSGSVVRAIKRGTTAGPQSLR